MRLSTLPEEVMSKPTKIALIKSEITLDDLKAIEAAEPRTEDRPRALRLQDIHVADQVFQPRQTNYNVAASTDHVKDLAAVLRSQKKPLDPIIVVPVGSRFFVVDGHHRLSAYGAVQWAHEVPVEVRDCSLDDAIRLAIAVNIKSKLPMTASDKQEAAWRLTKEGLSKQKTHDLTVVSTSNIGNMRRVLKALREQGKDVEHMTWRQALRADKAIEIDFDRQAWVNEKAQALSAKLLKSAGTKIVNNPEVLAEAIRMISPRLPMALIEEWHEEAYDYVEENREAIEEERRIDQELDI